MTNRILDWLYHYASFLPGIGLTVGYFVAVISEPPKTFEFVDYVARYHDQKIGSIPKWHHESMRSAASVPVMVMQPELDTSGRPVLQEVKRTVEGKGTPTVFVKERKEIYVRSLAEQPYTIQRVRSPGYVVERNGKFITTVPRLMTEKERETTPKGGIRVHYSPNIQNRSTGTHEVFHDVSWQVDFDPNSVSIHFGIIGTLLGLLVFHGRPFLRNK